MTLPVKFPKTSQVVMAHADGPEFTLLDRKVFNVLYANAYRKIKVSSHDRNIYTMNMQDLALAVLQPHDDLRMIRESLDRLWKVKITINFKDLNGNPHTLRGHYLSYAMSEVSNGELTYAFDEILMQFISNQRVYSLIELDVSSSMKTFYGSKLYEAISMIVRKRIQRWRITIEDLRVFFELGDRYHRVDHFKREVIDKAINDVNQNAPYIVVAEYKRGGRGGKIEGVVFKARPKQPDELSHGLGDNKVRSDVHTIDMFDGKTETDRLLAPILRSDTIAEVERIMATEDGEPVDVDALRDQWFDIYGARTHGRNPDQLFLSWVRIESEKRKSESLKGVDIDAFMSGLIEDQ